VLEIGAVEGARGQQHRGGIEHAGGRHGTQGLEQQVGIVLDRLHVVAREQVGKQPHHHLAVLEQVAHPRGHAQVVFEHVVLTPAVGTRCAHQVDTGDHRVEPAGHVHALHLGAELGVVEHLPGRNAAGTQDLAVVVDIAEEGVECAHALAQTGFECAPFVTGDDARQQVEGDQPFRAAFGAIDIEGDTDAVEGDVGFLALARDALAWGLLEPVGVGLVVRPHRGVCGGAFRQRALRCSCRALRSWLSTPLNTTEQKACQATKARKAVPLQGQAPAAQRCAPRCAAGASFWCAAHRADVAAPPAARAIAAVVHRVAPMLGAQRLAAPAAPTKIVTRAPPRNSVTRSVLRKPSRARYYANRHALGRHLGAAEAASLADEAGMTTAAATLTHPPAPPSTPVSSTSASSTRGSSTTGITVTATATAWPPPPRITPRSGHTSP
jgi:hypothetical protein